MKSAADILANKKTQFFTIESDKTIYEALTKMNAHHVGAIVVVDGGGDDIVGIWTERDLMRDILIPGFDPHKAIIGDYMTRDLHAASHETSINELKEMILDLFIRHILIEKNNRYIGLLSVGDVIRASLIAQDAHIEALKSHTSWHYYESWGWEKAKSPSDRTGVPRRL